MSQFTLVNNIGTVTKQLRSRSERIVAETAFGIESKIKASMAQAKSGRKYGSHVASAPGEAPAIETSALANSIETELDGLSATIGTNQEYALPLEFGTVRMAARPSFAPAFAEAGPEFERKMKEVFV